MTVSKLYGKDLPLILKIIKILLTDTHSIRNYYEYVQENLTEKSFRK